LRPMSLLMLVIGAVSFVATLTWWIVPLTLASYVALVFLAARDPLFWESVLEGREGRPGTRPISPRNLNVSPKQRVRQLRRGETRRKVEAALEAHRRTRIAIEESGDVAKILLSDALPKLDGLAERLVDVAEKRERTAETIRDLRAHAGTEHREAQNADLAHLENELHAVDAEISATSEKFSTLRTQVVHVFTESGDVAREAAAELMVDLDETNLRLDTLRF